jgi:hypothetical protein
LLGSGCVAYRPFGCFQGPPFLSWHNLRNKFCVCMSGMKSAREEQEKLGVALFT